MEIISSKDNKKIKYIRGLMEKGSIRKKNRQFVVEGIKLVDEALKYGDVSEIVITESLYAVVGMPCYRLLDEDYLDKIYSKTGKIKLLILEDTSDPGNLGTIMRTAEAAGVTGVIMTKGTVDIFNPKVVRSTMGSIFRLPFAYVEDLKEVIKELKKSGISFYAAHLKGEKSYKAIQYSDRSAILIGNESRGLNDKVADLADTYVIIPMQGKVESLNAAVAAALMMYEV